ncbi:MAG: type II toxin-antitoxin system RelE/ParE family toxin [Ectothiorhodospiraceae bacterium]|nr:type II toxin-antitoxin system RelE/ParE family toxin [Ectothiorhodospiraceae bacterium]
MEVKWTSKALSDLNRLFEFLAPVNQQAAAKTVQSLTAAPMRIIDQPRIGERLDEFEAREVRRLLVGHYEMRYELNNSVLYVLRIWHTREQR